MDILTYVRTQCTNANTLRKSKQTSMCQISKYSIKYYCREMSVCLVAILPMFMTYIKSIPCFPFPIWRYFYCYFSAIYKYVNIAVWSVHLLWLIYIKLNRFMFYFCIQKHILKNRRINMCLRTKLSVNI